MKTLLTLCLILCSTLASAATIPLVLSSGDAFTQLGRWCGGIWQSSYATGFDGAGMPMGYVNLTTYCSAGRGGRMTIYSKWVHVVWDLSGVAVTELGIAQPQVNTSAVFTLTPYAEYTMAHWNGRVNGYQAQLVTP